MTDLSIITDHPDVKEIVDKIVIGISSKDISNWLKVKYPDADQKHLHLSQKVLQEFAEKHGDLDATINRDVLLVKANKDTDAKISNALMNNKTYRERLLELSDEKLDLKKKIQELIVVGMARLEQVYDRIQENPTNTKNDYVLLKWFEQMLLAYEKADKIINNAPDQVIQHNITIQAVEQHTAVLQETVRKVLHYMDPEMAALFMELLTKEIANLKAPQQEQPYTLEKTMAEAEVLKDMLEFPEHE